jgi:deoxyadenosine/deoxycytidine kinase
MGKPSQKSPLWHPEDIKNIKITGMDGQDTVMTCGLVSKPKLIYLEGNIGSGKTTLLDLCREHEDLEIIEEPVGKWQNFYNHNMLQLIYTDKRPEMQLIFQIMANLSRLDQLNQIKSMNKTIMMERSLLSGYQIFSKAAGARGELKDLEMNMLHFMDKIFTENKLGEFCKPDLIIYLRTDPEICLERIQHRGRHEERGINLQYLNLLHQAHDKWLGKPYKNRPNYEVPCPVITLDGNRTDEEYTQLLLQLNTELEKLKGKFSSDKINKPQWDIDAAIKRWKEKRIRGIDVIDSTGEPS